MGFESREAKSAAFETGCPVRGSIDAGPVEPSYLMVMFICVPEWLWKMLKLGKGLF